MVSTTCFISHCKDMNNSLNLQAFLQKNLKNIYIFDLYQENIFIYIF